MSFFKVGSRVRLTKSLLERPAGSLGIVREILDPTLIVDWETPIPGVLGWTELLPEFVEVVSTVPKQEFPQSSINYQTHFGSTELGKQAQQTLSQFLAFAGRTLEQLVKLGAQLSEIRQQCTETLGIKEGKKAFQQWLKSDEFGGSRYLAESAIRLSEWFSQLSSELQQLIITKANHWSIAALKQLPSLTHDIVTQLVQTGRQTATSIQSVAKKAAKKPRTNPPIDFNNLEPGESLIFSPPERTGDDDLDSLIGCQVELIGILNQDSDRPTLQIRHLNEPEKILVCHASEVRKPPTSSVELEVNQLQQELTHLKEILAAQSGQLEQLKQERDRYCQQLKNLQTQQKQEELTNLQQECERYQQENRELREKLVQLEQRLEQDLEQPQAENADPQPDEKDLLLQKLTEQLKVYRQLELPLTNEQLFVGAHVKVLTCDQGWTGYTGVIKGRFGNGDWWLQLDGIDSTTRQLYKAGQLAWIIETKTAKEKQLESAQNRTSPSNQLANIFAPITAFPLLAELQ